MYVSRLALDHFRSWEHLVVDLAPGVTILQGRNGLGKTNIVEAVEVLSTGTSHRVTGSLPLIERGQTSATIRANVTNITNPLAQESTAKSTTESVHTRNTQVSTASPSAISSAAQSQSVVENGSISPVINPLGESSELTQPAEPTIAEPTTTAATITTTTYELTIAARGANRARINGGKSTYLRDVIGRIPSVSFTPDDQRLIAGDPAGRRTLLNQAGALLVPGYSDRLQMIAKIARQRAALLKQLGDPRNSATSESPYGYAPSPADAALQGLEIWTGQFIEAGVTLTRDRQRLVDLLAEPFAAIYRELAGRDERVRLTYEPSFDEVLLYPDDPQPHISEHFQRIYPGEVARGQNLIGPHRDDLSIELNGMPAREFASNGEMWTMALALKMALHTVIVRERGVRPIVILDDVFAQLDESRRRQILDFAARQDQVLITVAAASDIPDVTDLAGATGGAAGGADVAADGQTGATAAQLHIIDVADLVRQQNEYLHPDLAAFGIEVNS
nr:DNA replication and repair protein RecF [Bifidobacterium hapali]